MSKKSLGIPSGFRDLLSKDSILKNWLATKITEVYQKWGFITIETPIVEFTETLTGEVTDFNLFSVSPSKERQSGIAQSLSLRFDHTVPLARFIVDHRNDVTLPFKRYVYGPVFRGETAQVEKGRYRQFDQLDVDIVGSSNISSDIEVMLCMRDTMFTILGNSEFTIYVNTRKLLNCLPLVFGFEQDKLISVLIELDKRDKVSNEILVSSLISIGISTDSAQKLVEFGSIKGKPNDVLVKLQNVFKDLPEATEALSDLQFVSDTLDILNISEIVFDMSIIRGLGYYTGMIFETKLKNAPQFGSVYSGGRYDNLVENFGSQPIPAVGASVGVDRLVSALQFLNFKILEKSKKIIVLIQDKSVTSYAFSVADVIRKLNFVCEVYTGNKKKLGDQFAYADKLSYDYVVIVGIDEMNNNTVNIKDQKTKEQKTVNISEIKLN